MFGCGQWSAVGTYSLALIWREGDCAFTEPGVLSFVASRNSDGSLGVSAFPGSEGKSRANEGIGSCVVDLDFTLPPGGFMDLPIESIFQLHIVDDESNGVLNGDGHVELGMPRNCIQLFLIGGAKTL